MNMKTLLLLGAKGQLGQTFRYHFSSSTLADKYSCVSIDVEELDLSKEETIFSFLTSNGPSVIVNCAAYTAVDAAETETCLAQSINDVAVGKIASWASINLCRLIHISTDFVFDGTKREPYLPLDHARPVGVYGKTKLAGEKHVLDSCDKGIVIRTSWLYSEFGQNFVKTMIKLMMEESELGVVDDQIGSPTSTHSLVNLIFSVIERENFCGILHWCDGASISWYDFALEIQKQAIEQGLLKRRIPLRPLSTEEYETLAVRPAYSVLDRGKTIDQFGVIASSWRAELGMVINRMTENIGS